MPEIEELILTMESGSSEEKREAIMEFAKTAKAAIETLKDMIVSEQNVKVKYLAKKALNIIRERLEGEDSGTKLNITSFDYEIYKKLINSEDSQKRIKAIQYANYYKEIEILPDIFRLLETEEDKFVIATAVKALGFLGGIDEIDKIEVFLKDSDSRVRANAIEGLEFIGDERCFNLIIPMLKDNDNRVLANAAKALQRYGAKRTVNILRDMLRSDKVWMKESALFALSKIKFNESITVLVEAAEDPDIEIRKKAKGILKNLVIRFGDPVVKLIKEARTIDDVDDKVVVTPIEEDSLQAISSINNSNNDGLSISEQKVLLQKLEVLEKKIDGISKKSEVHQDIKSTETNVISGVAISTETNDEVENNINIPEATLEQSVGIVEEDKKNNIWSKLKSSFLGKKDKQKEKIDPNNEDESVAVAPSEDINNETPDISLDIPEIAEEPVSISMDNTPDETPISFDAEETAPEISLDIPEVSEESVSISMDDTSDETPISFDAEESAPEISLDIPEVSEEPVSISMNNTSDETPISFDSEETAPEISFDIPEVTEEPVSISMDNTSDEIPISFETEETAPDISLDIPEVSEEPVSISMDNASDETPISFETEESDPEISIDIPEVTEESVSISMDNTIDETPLDFGSTSSEESISISFDDKDIDEQPIEFESSNTNTVSSFSSDDSISISLEEGFGMDNTPADNEGFGNIDSSSMSEEFSNTDSGSISISLDNELEPDDNLGIISDEAVPDIQPVSENESNPVTETPDFSEEDAFGNIDLSGPEINESLDDVLAKVTEDAPSEVSISPVAPQDVSQTTTPVSPSKMPNNAKTDENKDFLKGILLGGENQSIGVQEVKAEEVVESAEESKDKAENKDFLKNILVGGTPKVPQNTNGVNENNTVSEEIAIEELPSMEDAIDKTSTETSEVKQNASGINQNTNETIINIDEDMDLGSEEFSDLILDSEKVNDPFSDKGTATKIDTMKNEPIKIEDLEIDGLDDLILK